MIFSAIGAGNILLNKKVEHMPHQDIQYNEKTTDDIPEFQVLGDKGLIELINEGFEAGSTPAGWTNTGWLWDYQSAPCEGIHWDYSWAAGDTLTTPALDFQVNTELTFQNAVETATHPMNLEIYVDGIDLVWSDYRYTHTDCELNTVDLSIYSGDHTISFVGMTSDFYGQILDDIVVTTVPSGSPGDTSIQVEKLVWNGTAWNDSAIVFENDIVEFKVSIYNPFDEYEIHWTGHIIDQLPCNLQYMEGSTTLPLEDHPDVDSEVIDLDNNTVWWQVDKESFISHHEYLNFSYSAKAICCDPEHYLCNNLTVSPHYLENESDSNDKIINDGSLNVSDYACVKVICEEQCNPDVDVNKKVKENCGSHPWHDDGVDIAYDGYDWVTYNITVTNTGDVPLDINVSDCLDSCLDFIAGSADPDTSWEDGSCWYWEFNDVPSGESRYIEYRAERDGCCDCDVKYYNDVTATGESSCDGTVTDADQVWVRWACDEPCNPDVDVNKEASLDGVNWMDDTIDTFVGDTVFFRINVSNTGNQVLDGVVVIDTLPSFLTFNNDANPVNIYYSTPDNEIRWFFAHIPVGEYRVITFSATVTGIGVDENIATVTTCGGPGAEDDVTIDASGGMHVEKLVSLDGEHWVENVTAEIGSTVRFIINISYYTDSDLFLFDFYIEDTLPCGLVYADDAYPEEPEIAGQTLYWNFTGDDEFLLNGSYLTVAFNATIFCEGEMINTVNVTARECSYTTLYGEDDAIVYVEPGPCMLCEKTVQAANGSWVDEINANVGDTVRFNITVSNIGYYPIYGIVVRDTLPSILTYVSDSAVIKYDGETILYSDCWDYDVYDEENNTLFFDNLNICTKDHLDPDETISLLFDAEVIAEGIGVNLANITACMCNQCEWLQCSDTAVVNVSTTGNHAPAASNPDPADDSTDVDPDDVALSVTAIDNDDDTMNVSFYNASDGSLIKKVTGVSNDSTASANWGDLAHNTTYTWYVVVDDSKTTAQSATWSFKTEPVGMNHAPDAPYNPTPSTGAHNVDRNPTLQVKVSDPDDDTLTVRFYDASDDSLIGTKNNVASGGTASVTWSGLSASTSYSWYAKASDSEYTTPSNTWSFTTESPDIDLDVELKGGLGVKVEIANSGSDDAEDVYWNVSVCNKGLFDRINKSDDGTINLVNGGGSATASFQVFGIGRVNISATVSCEYASPVTVYKDGLLIGWFLFIR